MDEVTPKEVVLALQKHPDTLEGVLRSLAGTTLGQWEQLGKLVYRRRIDGHLLVWAYEGSDGYWHAGMDAEQTIEWRMPTLGDVMREADSHLQAEGYVLYEDRTFPAPITENMMWRAVGLDRPDLFALRAVRQSMSDHQRSSATPNAGMPHDLERHTGRSTQVLVEALTLFMNDKTAVVIVPEQGRLGHMRRLVTTLAQPLKGWIDKSERDGFKLVHESGAVGELRLFTVAQFDRLWSARGRVVGDTLTDPGTRFLFDWG